MILILDRQVIWARTEEQEDKGSVQALRGAKGSIWVVWGRLSHEEGNNKEGDNAESPKLMS